MNKIVTAAVSAAVGVMVGVAVPAVADSPHSVCRSYSPYYAGQSAYFHYYNAVGQVHDTWVGLTPDEQAPWISAGSAAISNACLYDVHR